VILGTETGRLLLFESGELKTEFTMNKSDSAKERSKLFSVSLELPAFMGLVFHLPFREIFRCMNRYISCYDFISILYNIQ